MKIELHSIDGGEADAVTAPYGPASETGMTIRVTELSSEHPYGDGGHEFEYESVTDLFQCTKCGGYEIALRDRETGEIRSCPGACGRCKQTLDPEDRSWDGRGRYRDTGFCRGCVDRCHESTDFAHSCVICTEVGGDPR